MTMTKNLVGAVAVLLLLCGCATSRSVLAVNTAPQYQTANPEVGQAVKLNVVDARAFELRPATPDIPSLKNGEIGNTAITSRAIARKRNGYGKALGDVLLPEGQTVALVVGNAIAEGFKGAGYRIVVAGDPAYDSAVSVDATINQYWSWVDMGFWALTLNCRVDVTLTSSLSGLEQGLTTLVAPSKQAGAAFESDWQDIATTGLNELTREIIQKLPRQK